MRLRMLCMCRSASSYIGSNDEQALRDRDDVVAVGTTVGQPRFKLGYKLAGRFKELAPTREMLTSSGLRLPPILVSERSAITPADGAATGW